MHRVIHWSIVASLLITSVPASAQQWCAYNLQRAAAFDCGYSSETACAAAAHDPNRVCTRDPFFD
jgi:hypothetical protein